MTADTLTSAPPFVSQTIPAALTADDRGGNRYQDYGYLWHLGAAGVVELSDAKSGAYRVTDAVWFDERLRRTPARIALIDTGLADHPNLAHAIVRRLSIDFGTHEGGAAYRGRDETWADFAGRFGVRADEAAARRQEPRGPLPGLPDRAAVKCLLATLALELPRERHDALLAEIARRVERRVVLRDLSAQDQRYPSHGTASAGLLVGAPQFAPGRDAKDAEFADGTIPYFGVDPWSEVVPVATSFEPEPMQLTLALLYAVANGADVIHMPRGTDNAATAAREDPRKNRQTTRYDAGGDWDLFEAVLLAVSRRVPVVCAAGNAGDDRLAYPARLAGTGENGIVAVGAVTALGRRAGYSNYGDGLTLVAPSNDSRVYSRHQMRLDPNNRTAASHNWAIHATLDGGYVEYSHQAPVTLDIPGPRGFRGGLASRPEDRAEADYTLFGGTSAASAVVAGVAALMCRAMPERKGAPAPDDRGLRIKEALAASAAGTVGGRSLVPDISNRGDPHDRVALARLNFGAGAVNARAAIDRVHPKR